MSESIKGSYQLTIYDVQDIQKRQPNYKLKARVIENGLVKKYKRVSKAKFADYMLHKDGLLINSTLDIETANEMQSFFMSNNAEEWIEAGRVAKADFNRTHRLNKRIEKMLEKPCIFATLTFTDAVLAVTTVETRRKYVQRYLKSQGLEYVGNIDFGKKKEREHYHAVVQADKLDPKAWHYGAINVKRVKETSDNVKLAKYVNKLTNHAIKDTTKRNVLIYSR